MHIKPKENSDGKVGIRQTVIQGIKQNGDTVRYCIKRKDIL